MTIKISKPEINVRERLKELQKPSGIAGEAMLRAETPQEQFGLIGAGRKNFTRNGAMQIWQRGTSFSGNDTDANDYFADKWFMGTNTNAITIAKQSGVSIPGLGTKNNTLKLTLGATAGFDLYQAYEDWEHLSNKTVTISFWYRHTMPSLVIRQWSTNSWATVPSSDEWAYFSKTFTLGTLVAGSRAANTATIGFWSNSVNGVSGDTLEFTNYQLEIGSTATPFEHLCYGEELALCQRYYTRINVKVYSYITEVQKHGGNQYRAAIHLPTPMRIIPSISFAGLATWYGSGSLSAGFSAIVSGYTPVQGDISIMPLTLTPTSMVLANFQVGMLSADNTANTQYLAFSADV